MNSGANTTAAYSRIVEVEAYTVDNGATQRFDAWGNQIQASGTIPQYGYTGREPDETGLIFYRARYYDPQIGRFISRDPVGFGGGINQYAYVGNNPTNFTDPSGLKAADPVTTWVNNAYKGYVDLSGQGFTSAKQNLGTVTVQMLDDNGRPLVDQIPGMPPSGPTTPQTSFDKLKDSVGDVAGKFMDGLQALSPAEGVLVGAVGMIKGGATGVDLNKLLHIFGQEKHNLSGVIKQFGSEGKAFSAIQQATETAVSSQGLKGVFETTVRVGTETITVRGNIIDGVVNIGTAFKP